MNINQLIAPVPILKPEDTGDTALRIMEEYHLTELPLVAEDNYLGLIQESDLMELENHNEMLGAGHFRNFKPAIIGSAHPFEAIRLANEMNISVLPVVDNDQKYVGSVTKDSFLKYVSENSGISEPGGIIVLEILPRNYTLPEIARICENEDITIMNLQVHANERGMLEVTLKVNRSSLDALVSSFERHKYHVTEVFGEKKHDDDMTEKYHLLMNYINM
jgi:acetoin utilization protein AcuB